MLGARGRYASRRLLIAGPTLLGLSFLIFILGSFVGDPSAQIAARDLEPGEVPSAEQIAAVRHELGLDRAVLIRYGEWLGGAIQGDLGRSLFTNQTVSSQISGAVPATVSLAAAATVLVVALSIPLAILATVLDGGPWRQAVRLVTLGGASIPNFFLAYLLIYVLAVELHLLPVVGGSGVKGIAMPAVTLAVGPTALVTRLIQKGLVEQLGSDYVRTARSKGLSELSIMVLHALKNAFLPVMTVLGGVLARLLEGAVVVEFIFSRSGIGNLTLLSVGSGDYPVSQGVVLFVGFVVIAFNLLTDLTYPVLDPRVRLGANA